ncbi:Nucleolar pre-ribosomal-associated protein 1, partial [Melipona quadrifasciata]
AITVFSALKILLMKILSQYPQYQSSAEAACRHLINSHLSIIHSMLSIQSNAKQQKVVLQLLAAIVSFGGNLPRELLTYLSLPMEVIKFLVQHTKPTDDQNTRNCFIHFILAFLIDGSTPIIRILLDKRDLFYSIFPDLIYDSKDIIVLVLTTFKIHILQNPNISKTMKLQLFPISIIQNFVNLYNWKGPTNCPKLKNRSFISDSQIVEEKIDRPWEYEKPSNLVIKIMTSCPDLIKAQFIRLEPYIEPRVSLKWIKAMKFVKEVNGLVYFLS